MILGRGVLGSIWAQLAAIVTGSEPDTGVQTIITLTASASRIHDELSASASRVQDLTATASRVKTLRANWD